jgi:GH43 family beta-xylosidase
VNTFKESRPLIGQDPHITKYKDRFLLCESQDEERIVLSYLTKEGRQDSKIVWAQVGEHQIWAPELHRIDGLWYIYYSSSDGKNVNHRTKVLGAAMNPFGPYHWSEILDKDNWGIDMTIFTWKNSRYAVWSGWENTKDEFPQNLYIAPMVSPVEIGTRVLLSSAQYSWEHSIASIMEGPQAWIDEGTLHILYSANGSWKPEYATGILELVGNDPLNPSNWIKCPWPLRLNAGHGMIVGNSFIFHRKMSTLPGWQDREIVSIFKEKFLEDGRFKDFKRKM